MLKIARFDDVDQNQRAAGALRPSGGIRDRPFAFGRFIDDTKKLAPVTGFPAQSFRYHSDFPVGPDGNLPSGAAVGKR